MSLGQKVHVENMHSLTFGVVLVLFGRCESMDDEGRPGPLNVGDKDLVCLTFIVYLCTLYRLSASDIWRDIVLILFLCHPDY